MCAGCKDDDPGEEDETGSSSSSSGVTTSGVTTDMDSTDDGVVTTLASGSGNTDPSIGSDSTSAVPTTCGDGILVAGDVCFGPPTLISSTPTGAVLLGDFDEDGVLDMAAGHDDSVSISIGVGDGSFVGGGTINTLSGVLGLAAGDLDGDSNLDLVIAESGAGEVSIHLGDGMGGFALVDALSDPDSFPRSVHVGQFGGTAALDLVVVGEESGEVAAFTGNGDGTFTLVETIAAGLAPLSGTVAAIDDDAMLDLVVPLFGGGSIGVFWGEAMGFSDVNAIATGSGPRATVASDFDDDGFVDIASSDQDDGTISIHAGLGQRLFAPPQASYVGQGPRGMTLGDVDGDGHDDIFVAVEIDNAVGVLRSESTGVEPVVTVATFPRPAAIAVGDLNADGAVDIVTGSPAATGGIAVNLATP